MLFLRLKAQQFLNFLREDESGIGVVELILILVVLIGLVLIFKEQLTQLIHSIFQSIQSDANNIKSH